MNSDKPNPQPLSYVSAFAEHLFDNNHSPSNESPLILHFSPKGRKLDLLESLEIKKAIARNEPILNNQLETTKSTIIDLLINQI